MDVRGWLIFIRDWLLVLLIGTAMAGAAAFLISSALPRTYEAETRLLVGQPLTNPDYTQLLAWQIVAQTYAEVATARPSLDRVVNVLQLDLTPEELARDVQVRAPANSTFLVVTAQSTDPAEAADIANALADVLLTGSEDDPVPPVTRDDLNKIDADIADTTTQITNLLLSAPLTPTEEGQLAQLQDQRDSLRAERTTVFEQLTSAANLTVVEPAVLPREPVSPRILINTLVGAFVGLLITALATYAFDATERRAESQDRAAAQMASPRFPTR
jgi:capsular polysaccharide biosynthesis protein